jgi:hypothetical protein
MSKKVKQIDLEQWLSKKQSWFLSDDFAIVKDFMSKQDSATVDKLCDYFKGGVTYLSHKHDARLYSPKTMLVMAIFGVTPMLEFTMHSKYSVLTHWLWRFLTFVKYISILVIAGIAWYVYDIVTVKKKTQQYNFDVFCQLTGCQETDTQSKLSEITETAKMGQEGDKNGKAKNTGTVKILSVIGLVWYFLLIVGFGIDVIVNNFDTFYDSGALIILGALGYAIPYSIIGLTLLWKNKVMKVMSVIGILWNILVLSILVWFFTEEYGELLSPFAGILFVLYNLPYTIVGLVQSSKSNCARDTNTTMKIANEAPAPKVKKERKAFQFPKIPKYAWFVLGGLVLCIAVFLTVKNITKPEYYEIDYSLEWFDTKENLPADFIEFLDRFSSNRETQISLIHKPYSIFYYEYEEDYEDVKQKQELWNERQLEKEWVVMTPIFGIKKTDDGYSLYGEWMQPEDNVIIYSIGVPNSDNVSRLVFKKIDNKWCLYSCQ